ncbi:hypothetical protein A2U01_0003832, partial [Trifolium medium]|nr:hypothetical protein [Trifolium medium]
DGSCVGAARKVVMGSADVVLAKAQGLSEALCWIESDNLERVIVEMNAQAIVKVIQSSQFPIESHQHIVINWVRRSGDSVAHEIAK